MNKYNFWECLKEAEELKFLGKSINICETLHGKYGVKAETLKKRWKRYEKNTWQELKTCSNKRNKFCGKRGKLSLCDINETALVIVIKIMALSNDALT